MGSAFCRSSNRAPPVHWFAYCSSTLSACWLSTCWKGGPGEKNVGCGGGMGASGRCWGVCEGGKGACGGGTGACVGMADLKSSWAAWSSISSDHDSLLARVLSVSDSWRMSDVMVSCCAGAEFTTGSAIELWGFTSSATSGWCFGRFDKCSYPEKYDAELSARGSSTSLSLSVTEPLVWDGDYTKRKKG